jgi:Pyruvate/2-oxoacid:ferredoxin oxidoreductase gamma subunit
MTYRELSVWTRGIIMDKEARDIANCVANAALKAGFYSQMISDYVDDPDRTNCLVRKYARFSDEPFEFKFIYENPHPDWVVLVEETLIKAVNFFRGTYDGSGTLVVNSARDPEYLLKFLPDYMLQKLKRLVVVDAVSLAEQQGSSPWMFVRDLGQLAYDRMSTEGANERSAVGIGIAAPLVGALTAATAELPLEIVAETLEDREAFYRGAEHYRVLDYAETDKAMRAAAGAPVAGAPAQAR